MESARVIEKQNGIFYGWVIVAVMAVAGAVSMGMGTLNYGLFIKPMGDELGISRSMFGWGQTVRQVMGAFTSPFVGSLIDRFGSRILLAAFTIVTAAALASMALVNQGWQLLLLFAIMGAFGMTGPGALVTSVPVAKWFVQKRGKAFSFVTLGIPAGGIIFVPLTQVLIEAYGWRWSWVILAVLAASILVPASLQFLRRQPEDMGLLPDGEDHSGRTAAQIAAQARVEEPSWTRDEALRSSEFWRLTFVFSLVMLAISSIVVHRIPALMDRGLDPNLVSFAIGWDAVTAGASTFAMGMLLHRIQGRFLGSCGFVVLAFGVFLIIIADSTAVMFLAMTLWGLGAGGLILMQNFIWADYFGREHLGQIRGVMTPVTLVFGGAGAPVAGYVRDATGSYDIIWYIGVGLLLLGAVVLATTPVPRKKPAPQTATTIRAG